MKLEHLNFKNQRAFIIGIGEIQFDEYGIAHVKDDYNNLPKILKDNKGLSMLNDGSLTCKEYFDKSYNQCNHLTRTVRKTTTINGLSEDEKRILIGSLSKEERDCLIDLLLKENTNTINIQ